MEFTGQQVYICRGAGMDPVCRDCVVNLDMRELGHCPACQWREPRQVSAFLRLTGTVQDVVTRITERL